MSPSPTPPASLLQSTTYRLSAAGRASRASAVAALAREELRLDHVAALAVLTEGEPPSQRSLGDRLAKDPGDVVRLVDELERRGWATRSRDPADRRRSLVGPTADGEDVLRRAMALLAADEDEVLAPLTAKERRTLHALLERLDP
ncbi:MarR family winged helix-turn-helix transcriptional regulator [Patulibacter minatonensis]|uniref:MarR family winged helix-turn-helix transcriptional regulator n=1 Tax=Patulibacter minatonensis TaxID=298163 RepID=UPI0004B0EA30|nr:MarR family winged helix-turn-helix transcriptional regulator [Patulibacter minatonensis]